VTRVLAAAVVLALAAACSTRDDAGRDRCVQCGMRVDPSGRWTAGAKDADGSARTFDAPQCLFRWLRGRAGRGGRDAWVRDYYAQRRISAEDAFFVAGSDVLGPMGPDLVPLATRAEADRFGAEHHGRRILRYDEIDARALQGIHELVPSPP
jgi:nitrous oxide reductase accessory protein NosL